MKTKWHKVRRMAIVCVMSTVGWAGVGSNTDLYTQRANMLFSKLRCLTCLHQSVSDSDSPFAEEVKDYVLKALGRSKSDEQILSDLTRTYGQQVLWSPPKQGVHWVVWLMPVGLGLVVFFKIVWRMMRGA